MSDLATKTDIRKQTATYGALYWIIGIGASLVISTAGLVAWGTNLAAGISSANIRIDVMQREGDQNIARRDKLEDQIVKSIEDNETKDSKRMDELQAKMAVTDSGLADIKAQISEIRARQDDSFALLQKIDARTDRANTSPTPSH